MSHYSKVLNKVPVQIPNKSGFDLSHENLFTAKCGTLYPVMVDTLLPNDTISLGHSSQLQLPPMATDFYGRVMGKFEAFFVPFRVLYGGWQDLITHPVNGDNYPTGTTANQKAKVLPTLRGLKSDMLAGSLADFLGRKIDALSTDTSSSTQDVFNPLPFLAYHKIYNDWYRDSRIQQEVFQRNHTVASDSATAYFDSLPYQSLYGVNPALISGSNLKCADGVSALSLRQRNWERDYFTNATPKPQAGDPAQLAFNVADGQGSFTIASLRAANALQQWLERNNIAGYRYGDQIKAQFGIYPADAVTDRAIYLGRHTVDIYNRSVYQTTGLSTGENQSVSGNSGYNPFDTVGSKFGSPQGVGENSLVDHFTASEHGFIFVMFSIVPRAYYGTGDRRYLRYARQSDFAFPLLAGVGDQEIYLSELSNEGTGTAAYNSVFGYTQRFSEYKYMDDEVHGLLRDGQSLSAFALKRSFSRQDVALGSAFLQIPQEFLDQVGAYYGASSSDGDARTVNSFGAWCDVFFAYKKVSTLPAYSIPTLGDPKDTHTEVIDNGGKRL